MHLDRWYFTFLPINGYTGSISASTQHKIENARFFTSNDPYTLNYRQQFNEQKLNIPNDEDVFKTFQQCLSTKGAQQQLITNQFYADINKWSPDQFNIFTQIAIVNFLFWYYRSMNGEANRTYSIFYPYQAEHIRYWADYPITSDTKYDYYNIKFDYMYSAALLEKSIPHMKKFYRWICSQTPIPTPNNVNYKPNYYLTRYQASCILGDWGDDGVKPIGQIIENISTKANIAKTVNNDYFMVYTLRALELPETNPNFSAIFNIVDTLIDEFPKSELPRPIFTNWNILAFKYRNLIKINTDYENNACLEDKEFIFAADEIKDDDGYYTFTPETHKKMYIFGRICQIVSPVYGAAGYLPLTGTWSDKKLYMITNWTYRRLYATIEKDVIMKMERLPIVQHVGSKKGYVWRGHIAITITKLIDTEYYTENDRALFEFARMKEKGEIQAITKEYEVEMIIDTNMYKKKKIKKKKRIRV